MAIKKEKYMQIMLRSINTILYLIIIHYDISNGLNIRLSHIFHDDLWRIYRTMRRTLRTSVLFPLSSPSIVFVSPSMDLLLLLVYQSDSCI